jgi:hypothetical protein
MKKLLLLLVLAGCGGNAPSLVGNWIYVNGSSGIAATFRDDGTYVASKLALTSSASADAEIETGTYMAADGTLTTIPQQWTCPGPDPVTAVSYSLDGVDLQVSSPSGVLVMSPNSTPASSNFALTFGCFDSSGSFTPQSLAPVSN